MFCIYIVYMHALCWRIFIFKNWHKKSWKIHFNIYAIYILYNKYYFKKLFMLCIHGIFVVHSACLTTLFPKIYFFCFYVHLLGPSLVVGLPAKFCFNILQNWEPFCNTQFCETVKLNVQNSYLYSNILSSKWRIFI